MAEDRIEDMNPHDRRRFFRASLGKLLGPLADAVEKRLPIQLPIVRPRLRPPGARPEREFLETCFRCGACADSCPADAINLMQTTDEDLRGTPYVDPDLRACVICDELACMKACPSGALQLVGRLEIRMGLAQANHHICTRSQGEDCTICVDQCPIGREAIRVDGAGRIEVLDPRETGVGCTGCGVCQLACPTTPKKAIRVAPY